MVASMVVKLGIWLVDLMVFLQAVVTDEKLVVSLVDVKDCSLVVC